jgi:squalene-hopene/tetraprenyl-beta-curcumene cyclase
LLHHDSELAPIATYIADEFVVRQRFDGGWSPWSGAESSRRSRGMLRANIRPALEVSSVEATAATLVLLAEHGVSSSYSAMIRGGIFLRQSQRGDGSWDSATGAHFLHGTTWAIRGLLAAGALIDDSAISAGLNWLVVHQQESGGWGEALGCSTNPREFVRAEATAIQTAWVVLALVAAGHADHDATRRGIEFLVGAQQEDGRWCDSLLSVRDSAGGSWYRNDLHSAALPLLALARWAVAIGQLPTSNESPGLRLVCDDSLN